MTQNKTVDGYRQCNLCEYTLPATSDFFHQSTAGLSSACKPCANKRTAAWRAERAAKKSDLPEWTRRNNLKKYNVTPEWFDATLAKQGGRCAVCGTTDAGGKHGQFHIDHDHSCCPKGKSCGKCVRGLLCHRCNVGLGNFKDDLARLEAAITYLRETRAVSTSDRLTA